MFHFVDRILSLEPGRHALGVKHVTDADAFLDERPGGRVLRPCIVGEALGQLGAWAVMQANDFTLRPVAGIARSVRLLAPVHPGDEIRLDTTIDALNEDSVAYHAVATVGGTRVVVLEEGLGPLLPLAEFDDAAELRARLLRIRGSTPVADPPADPAALAGCFDFADVDVAPDGRALSARKTIRAEWPFFADHFPRKPVFPLTLLLEGLFRLGGHLLGAQALSPAHVRRVKMNRFIEPGETLVVRAELKERHADRACVAFRCELDGERVCVAEADYA